MRFEFCCRSMYKYLDSLADITEDGKLESEGWRFSYCPFCGEKIEIVRFAREESE